MEDPFPDNPGVKLGSFVEAKTGRGRWLYRDRAHALAASRVTVAHARTGAAEAIEIALADEERRKREADRRYRALLRQELERLRHERP